MLDRKQIIMIVSIAVVSFLLGTALNTITMAMNGNPFDEIWDSVNTLQSKVEALENQTLPQGFVSAPAYNSGWIGIEPGVPITLEHGLGTTEVFVYLTAKNPEGKIHQRRYGGENANTRLQGGYWLNLTESEIVVRRLHDDDEPIHNWSQVRVMIWKIQEPTS